jgi:hypothetical protein
MKSVTVVLRIDAAAIRTRVETMQHECERTSHSADHEALVSSLV